MRLPFPLASLRLQDIHRILYNDVKLFLLIGFDSIIYMLCLSRWCLILIFYSVEIIPHKWRFALRFSLQYFIGWPLSHSLYFNKWQKIAWGNLSPDTRTRCLDENRQACRIIALMLCIWQDSKMLVFGSLSYHFIAARAWRKHKLTKTIDVVAEDSSNSVAVQKKNYYNWTMTDFRWNKDFNRTLSLCINDSTLIPPPLKCDKIAVKIATQ